MSEQLTVKRDFVLWVVGAILAAIGGALAASGWYSRYTTSIMPGTALLIIGIILVVAWAAVRKR